MKKIIGILLIAAIGVAFAGHGGGTEASGYYWWMDNSESNQPFPPQPIIDPPDGASTAFNTDAVNAQIAGEEGVSMLAPYNDRLYQVELQDSFWYYGVWRTPYDVNAGKGIIWISPDGWVSFNTNTSEDGAPNPPGEDPQFPNTDEPNGVIAPYWVDLNPTIDVGTTTPQQNRVWHFMDLEHKLFHIQWYMLRDASDATGNTWYNFKLVLVMGGQDLVWDETDDPRTCGTLYSRHIIDFYYFNSSSGWTVVQQQQRAVGIEDFQGDKGIDIDIDTYVNNGVGIRFVYRKVFRHDLEVYYIESPGNIVLRWTKIEPRIVVANFGTEAENYAVNMDITEGSNSVYHQTRSGFHLLPYDPNDPSDDRFLETISFPCWDTPGEYGTKYTLKAEVTLDNDECTNNNVLERPATVQCDDTLGYEWGSPWIGWGAGSNFVWGTYYPVENGGLVTGGRFFVSGLRSDEEKWVGMLLENSSGCGIGNTKLSDSPTGLVNSVVEGWNEFTLGKTGVWANSAEPGNIWIGVRGANSSNGWFYEVTMAVLPLHHACWGGATYGIFDRNRGGRGNTAGHTITSWNGYTGYDYTYPTEIYGHLVWGPYPLSPAPQDPCYFEEAHDLKVLEITAPDRTLNYVEDGEPITPEVEITNLGRVAEPDQVDYFKVYFQADYVSSGETQYKDSTNIDHIGYLGADDGDDTLYVGLNPWTPEGQCDPSGAGVEYTIYGIVRADEVGEPGKVKGDHCPYNDTVSRNVTALLSHDVGVNTILEPTGDEVTAGDEYTPTCIVNNYGYHEESNFQVVCEVKDVRGDTNVYENHQMVSHINWIGNTIDEPWIDTVEFAVWHVPTTDMGYDEKHPFTITFRTELVGDGCPDDDAKFIKFNQGIAEGNLPVAFELSAVKPNPFVANATINYAVPVNAEVTISVYDITGKLVKTLVSGNVQPGYHNVVWDGSDNNGSSVAQGIYLIRMETAGYKATEKVILTR